MSAKSVPLSVRLSAEDAAYIASLQAPDAVTMSEKVRFLVSEARITSEQGTTFEGTQEQIRNMLLPLYDALGDAKATPTTRSRLLDDLLIWLPVMVARLATIPRPVDEQDWIDILQTSEAQAGVELTYLLDRIARLGVTEKAPCIDPDIAHKILEPLEELFETIQNNKKRRRDK